jgi:hypothetical protein
MPFAKTPKKILHNDGEAGFYSDGPLDHGTTEIKLEVNDDVFGNERIRFFVTVAGRLIDFQSRGVDQPGIEVQTIVSHESIAAEAFFKYFIGLSGTAEDHWRAAEAEILGIA